MERPIIPEPRTNGQMSSVEYYDETRAMILRLEDRERVRGHDATTARRRVASRAGAAPGTLESYVRGRIKRVDAFLRDRVKALLITEIQHEITALTHELESLKAGGAEPHSAAIFEAMAALDEARRLMRGAK
jgi:hypothetical protein